MIRLKGRIYKHNSGFYLMQTGVDSTTWLTFVETRTTDLDNGKSITTENLLGTIPSVLVINNPDFTVEEYDFTIKNFSPYANAFKRCSIANAKWRDKNPKLYFT